MKIALVHDLLAEFGGAERVLISLKKAYPDADVYVSFVDNKRLGIHAKEFAGWNIYESWARYIPFFSRLYSPLRFLLPLIWRSFDLSSYDMVICSSSWGMCKGVSLIKSKGKTQNANEQKNHISTKFVCYLHTPPRYLYGYDESSLKKYLLVRIYALIVNHFLRMYDYESSQTIDQFIFNSEEIRQRSLKFYRRDGVVVHPPINIMQKVKGTIQKESNSTYFLTVSRLAPTKHIDVLIQAANETKLPLKIVGVGKEEGYLRSIAGPTVEFCGSVSDEALTNLYAGARAFLYASVDEDFGMVPVEAMAHGVPVIAYASGGVKETVTAQRGILYHKLTPSAVSEAIRQFETLSIDAKREMSKHARAYARALDETHFVNHIRSHLHT